LGAGDEVDGVDAADAAVAVPQLDLQALGRSGDVEVEQVPVALDEDAVGAGDGDLLVVGGLGDGGGAAGRAAVVRQRWGPEDHGARWEAHLRNAVGGPGGASPRGHADPSPCADRGDHGDLRPSVIKGHPICVKRLGDSLGG